MERNELIILLKECGYKPIGGPGDAEFYQKGNVKILLYPKTEFIIYRHRLAKVDLKTEYHQVNQSQLIPWVIGPFYTYGFNLGFNLKVNRTQGWPG